MQAHENIRPFWIAVKNYIDQGLQDHDVAPAADRQEVLQVRANLHGSLGKFTKAHGLPACFVQSYGTALRKCEDDALIGWRPTEKDIRKLLKAAKQPTLSAFIAAYAPQEQVSELPQWMQEITVDLSTNLVTATMKNPANDVTAFTLRLGYTEDMPEKAAVEKEVAVIRDAVTRALQKAGVRVAQR